MKNYKNIKDSISGILPDIKAEVIIADLIDKGLEPENIMLVHQGTFSRNYSKDLSSVHADTARNTLLLYISHDSLYDVLPEGLFHDISRFNNKDSDGRKIEFKKQKQEEANARKFFLPFDHEIYYQTIRLELELFDIFRDPLAAFKQLFKFDQSFPEHFIRRFLSFLPFSNEIKGNIELTASCLSELLRKEVHYNNYYHNKKFSLKSLEDHSPGKNSILGEDLVSSDHFLEETLTWKFTVISTDDDDISTYADLDKGFINKMISRFYDIFLPLEVEVVTEFICQAKRDFILGDGKYEKQGRGIYLGYNTSI
jgi:hypothetical protein